MPLLIDGYNLLHVTGIFGRGAGPGTLERSRTALLNFLAESLAEGMLPRTTVVFDAAEAPRGLPRTVQHRQMVVRYASEYASADELIEELIETATSPRQLIVVSSDHRLHRAARRRRATAIDSEIWYADLVEQRRQRHLTSPPVQAKPEAPLSADQVAYWLARFGTWNEAADDEPKVKPRKGAVPPNDDAAIEPASDVPSDGESPTDDSSIGEPPLYNPFPPGYATDVTDE